MWSVQKSLKMGGYLYMDKMKKYTKYLIIFLAFYFLSNILTVHLLKTTYQPKKIIIDPDSSPNVEIDDFKATITNGYVKGKVTNNTGTDMNGKYVKLDFYSKNGVNVGTKYVEINDLKPGETMDFSTAFNFDNVDSVKTSIVDQKDLPKEFNWRDLIPDDLSLDFFHAPWYIWLAAAIMVFV